MVEDVYHIYKTGSLETVALRGISFEAQRGECVTITGPSGSGKTTLLNLIAGIEKPSAGHIQVGGVEVTQLGNRELDTYRRDTVGVVFQFFNLLPALTSEENIEVPMMAKNTPRSIRKARSRELLEMVGMGSKRHNRPDQLSGGEQQRIAIAMSLANNPSLILADEPTGELDTETGREILSLMLSLSQDHGKTILIVSHDPQAQRIAQRTLQIIDGRIQSHPSSKNHRPNQPSQPQEPPEN